MHMVLEFLAPMIFMLSWVFFVYSNKLMTNLVTLLIMSIMLPTCFMQVYKMFWPCGMLLVLISTGLVVIFAYIVSLQAKTESSFKALIPSLIVGTMVVLLSDKSTFLSLSNLNLQIQMISVELVLSVVLITILIFLVVYFIRLVYSKGGGLRKKY